MELRIPGLGGVYIDRTGQAVVYLRDLSQRVAAMAALRQVASTFDVRTRLPTILGVEGATTIRQGLFAFSELVAWEHEISQRVHLEGFLSIDADESLNRVRVRIAKGASREAFGRAVAALGLPDSAVVFDVSPPMVSATDLREWLRPTGGGQQIQVVGVRTATCSLGFNVDVQLYNQSGLLTASHCDGSGGDGTGQTGAAIFQPDPGSLPGIATVTINPAWNRTDFDCGGLALCTGADVLFALAADTSSGVWSKRIYGTTVWGSNNSPGSLVINGWWGPISRVPFLVIGQTVYKVGRTTGVTSGTVSSTCENPLIANKLLGIQYVVLCADRATGASWGPGDSGGAVFYPNAIDGSPPYAIGILFAGSGDQFSPLDPLNEQWCIAGCNILFSQWDQIQYHLSRSFTP